MLNFITNFPLSQTSGGWNGISASVYEQLTKIYDTSYVGPISPPFPMCEKALSRGSRAIGIKGRYSFYATSRLNRISTLYQRMRRKDATIDFFHGATPWALCNPPCPYVTYIDATFSQYMEVFSRPSEFKASDLQRISDHEGQWLRNAAIVFCGSRWVQQRVIEEYELASGACPVVWVGGNALIPSKDSYEHEKLFLFITHDFIGKGGHLVFEAFQNLQTEDPEIKMVIIGEKPPKYVLNKEGIFYAGMLRKTVPEEYQLFCDYLRRACVLVHPTSKDTMGMVLIEAGYFGCPCITSRLFGIPELVKHAETGWLLDAPIRVNDLVCSMRKIMYDKDSYLKMRQQTRQYTTTNFSWPMFGQRLQESISRILDLS